MTRKTHDVLVKLGFEKTSVRLSIGAIQPLHVVSPAMKRSVKYAQICASIRELGTIEPPAVIRDEAVKGRYIMLDGHLRLEAFKDLGYAHIVCLVATEDEAFTYNKHISRLATVQEHRMIMKAIERGVSEKRIAKALNIRIETLRAKTQMLSGICPEAVELLKEKHIPMGTFRTLRRMAPLRQIEAAELMISMNNYSNGYATSLLAGTPREQLLESDKPKKIKGLTERQLELMERESASLDREFKMVEQSYGDDHLDLVLTIGYLRKLVGNPKVARYLAQKYEEILLEFRKLAVTDQVVA